MSITFPEHVQLSYHSSAEDTSPSGDLATPASVPSPCPSPRQRKMALSAPPPLFKSQLTPHVESQVPDNMIIVINQVQSDLEQQEVHQRNLEQHVKMGKPYPCPRTPLRSAGSSAGLTPTIKQWRQSRTESKSSAQSHGIPNITETYGHSADELSSILSLSFPTSPNSDQNAQSGYSCLPTPSSPRSCSSDAESVYSADSDAVSDFGALKTLLSCGETTLASPISPIIASPSGASPNSPISYANANGVYDSLLESKAASPELTSAPPRLITASPMNRNRRSRASSSSLTPSLVPEPTKTIQARRSFSQLLLFRRPSQVRAAACVCTESYQLHQPDEETEELQTYVDNTGSISLASTHIGRLNSLDNLDISNQLEDCSRRSLNQDLNPLEISSMSREGSAQTIFPLSRDAVSSHHSDQQHTSRRESTMLNRPKSLLKMVRSQSSLRETFFGGKMTQRTQSLQFDQLATNGIPTASARARSPSPTDKLTPVDPERSSEMGRDSVSTLRSGKPIQSDLTVEDRPAEQRAKRVSSSQAPSLNAFKFWQKKKSDNLIKANVANVESPKKNSDKQETKKSGFMKTGRRPPLQIDQISSPILISEETGIQSLRRHTRPFLSLSSPKCDDASGVSSHTSCSEKEMSVSSLNLLEKNSPHSLASGHSSTSTTASPPESTHIEAIIAVTRHLPKPSRPPRKRPVMVST
ncbi:hypothetical protein PCANC_06201 [Puccinia coronata f. sp. avenae]|uniref:Uncharacterized protein n=1 Tax=Puccinia coronata f. sp. avenae TaxID=200324 RepID=A0A2N5VTJ0_9BASI|nr:hypothetical protein PCASD_14554 [Puccinia coronata f. sp. avenae]PLW53313.1 hypothetical protein PCANC_06201 [Puccinia coronata f. sp. avenae]